MYVYVVYDYTNPMFYADRKYKAFAHIDRLAQDNFEVSHLRVIRYEIGKINPTPLIVQRD